MKIQFDVDWRLVAEIGFVLAVLLSLQTPDIDGENIGPWFHAKLFLEDFGFITMPKSPLHQLYLIPFSLLPHPASIILEKVATTFLCFLPVAGLMWACFGRGIGLATAVLAAPNVLQASPTAQALSFAAICLALYVRLRLPFIRVSNINVAYALLLAAWLLRSNTVIVFGVFAFYDLYRAYTGRFWRTPPRLSDAGRLWPLPVLLALTLMMAFNPSPHRWNYYHQIEQTWQPVKGQIASVLSFNIAIHYRARDPKTGGQPFDIYFTNKKFFGDAKTFPDMVRANPEVLIRLVGRNAGALLTTSVSMTQAGEFLLRFTGLGRKKGEGGPLDHRYVAVAMGAVLGAMFLYMVWTLWLDPRRREIAVLAAGLAAATAVAGLLTNGSSARIIYLAYGLFMLMAAFYAERMLARRRAVIGVLLALAVLLLLTQGGWARADVRIGWGGVVRAFHGLGTSSISEIFYSGNGQRTFAALNEHAAQCKGLMPAEMPQFIGTFSTIPERRLYSPFEIPPFGGYGDPGYTGLHKDRIDCLYVPNSMMKAGLGSPTNIRRRYRSYIKPYIQKLLDEGGRKIELPAGTLIVGSGQ